jgi:branched-chain amino acid transport system substrate-binding protein
MRKVALSVCAVAVTAAALAASGCSSSSSSAASGGGGSSSGEYKVGFTDGLTGSAAGSVQPELTDVKAVFAAINANGGINGHKIDLIPLDQGDPGSGRGPANILQLSSDGASAILGDLISDDCTAAASAAAQAKIPLMCVNDAPTDEVPAQQYLYVSTGLENQEVPAMVKFAPSVMKGGKTVDILTNDNIGAVNWAAAMKTAATNAGMTVKNVLTMPEDATSVAPYLSKIVADKPSAVFIEVFPNFEAGLVAGLKSAGLDMPIIGSIGDMDYASQEAYPQFYGVHAVSVLQPTDPNLTAPQKQLLAGYKSLGDTSAVAINASEGPDFLLAPYAIAQGLKACGYPCSGTQLAAALDKQSSIVVDGIIPPGAYGFSPTNHTGVKSYAFWAYDKSAGLIKQVGSRYPAATPAAS